MLLEFRDKYYKIGRFLAVFIISPYLIFLGKKYNDKSLIIIGIMIFIWDSIKLFSD